MRRTYFAACTRGVQAALVGELEQLGAIDTHIDAGGVHFSGDLELGYKTCLWLRTATRVHERIGSGATPHPKKLYNVASSINWANYLGPDQTFAIYATTVRSQIRHSQYASQVVKDAIVDQFRKRTGQRPNVDTNQPDLPIKLVIKNDYAILTRDFAGESLHKRGYRPVQVKSPLNEAIAAAILLLSDWDRRSPLVDPMCGSATLLIEAAYLAADHAPGLKRRFAFEGWKDFDKPTWDRLVDDALHRAKAGLKQIPPLMGADRHEGAVAIAQKSIARAGLHNVIQVTKTDIADFVPAHPPTCVVVNPPFGERIGEGDDLTNSWRALGAFLKAHCRNADAYVLCGTPELTRNLRLKASQRWPIQNGPLSCKLLKYHLLPPLPPKTEPEADS
jgi:putative N6-adenine-specific DNA methylase